MWPVFTYIYNSILILFIATHLIVGAILSFLAGLYIGVYLCQHYEIPKLNEPSKLWGKCLSFMEQYRKKPSLLNSGTILSIIQADTENNPASSIDQRSAKENTEMTSSPTLIFTDPEFKDMGQPGRPTSQILEASLVISQDELPSRNYD